MGPPERRGASNKRVLVVDVGGTHVKVLAAGQKAPREFPSGPTLTAEQMVAGVKTVVAGWKYNAVSIGYPGPVLHGRPVAEPRHLGPGWVGFDYRTAFGCPVKLVNDAAMQACGSYRGGKMLFLGLGTGLGTTLIVDGSVEPMELGHLPYRNGTFEEYVGLHGLQKHGLTQWRRDVEDVVSRLIAALQGGLGVDAAYGRGVVYEQGEHIGYADLSYLSPLTVGPPRARSERPCDGPSALGEGGRRGRQYGKKNR